MYLGLDGESTSDRSLPDSTGFAICLEENPDCHPKRPRPPDADAISAVRLLRKCRVQCQGGVSLPPNKRPNASRRPPPKGFWHDGRQTAMGNVAENGTANVFMVPRDGVVFHTIANGHVSGGASRGQRHTPPGAMGSRLHETVLSFDDFHAADEVFLTGNIGKLTPVPHLTITTYANWARSASVPVRSLGLGRTRARIFFWQEETEACTRYARTVRGARLAP